MVRVRVGARWCGVGDGVCKGGLKTMGSRQCGLDGTGWERVWVRACLRWWAQDSVGSTAQGGRGCRQDNWLEMVGSR